MSDVPDGMPDRAWLKPAYDSWGAYGHWYGDVTGGGAEFIPSTPAREHADELVDALEVIGSFRTLMPDGEEIATPEAAIALKALAKIKEASNE